MSAWREAYKVHPAADVFPMMSDDELDALGQDIKTNGLTIPVLFWRNSEDRDGKDRVLIDGRNRLEAMNRVGLDPLEAMTETFTSKDPVTHIISLNIHRRHDPSPSWRGVTADPVKAAAVEAAKDHGISKRTVERAIAKTRTVEEVIAADQKRAAALAATKERKKAEEQARRKLEALQTENMIAEVMGLLTPYLSREEINRVFELCIALNWPAFTDGFTYEGQKYGGQDAEEDDDAENGASTLPQDGRSEVPVDDPTPENEADLGNIPAGFDRRRRP